MKRLACFLALFASFYSFAQQARIKLDLDDLIEFTEGEEFDEDDWMLRLDEENSGFTLNTMDFMQPIIGDRQVYHYKCMNQTACVDLVTTPSNAKVLAFTTNDEDLMGDIMEEAMEEAEDLGLQGDSIAFGYYEDLRNGTSFPMFKYNAETKDTTWSYYLFNSTRVLRPSTYNGYLIPLEKHYLIKRDEGLSRTTFYLFPKEYFDNEIKGTLPPEFAITDQEYDQLNDGIFEFRSTLAGCSDITNNEDNFYCFQVGIQREIVRNFRFPMNVRDQIQGRVRVYVNFVIETDGTIGNVKVVRSSGIPEIDNAGIKAVERTQRMYPAILNGHPVRMMYTVPIAAQLQ